MKHTEFDTVVTLLTLIALQLLTELEQLAEACKSEPAW
jgi:hypothetical protein